MVTPELLFRQKRKKLDSGANCHWNLYSDQNFPAQVLQIDGTVTIGMPKTESI